MFASWDWLVLDEDERVIWKARPHPWSLMPYVFAVLGVVGTIAGMVAFRLLVVPPVPTNPTVAALLSFRWVPVWIGIVVFVLVTGQLAYEIIELLDTHYVLTTESIYTRSGVLRTDVDQIDLDRVQNVWLKKGVIGNLLNYGSVEISTAGRDGVEMWLTALRRPELIQGEIHRHLRAAEDKGAALGTGPSSELTVDQIRQLTDGERRIREAAEGLEESAR